MSPFSLVSRRLRLRNRSAQWHLSGPCPATQAAPESSSRAPVHVAAVRRCDGASPQTTCRRPRLRRHGRHPGERCDSCPCVTCCWRCSDSVSAQSSAMWPLFVHDRRILEEQTDVPAVCRVRAFTGLAPEMRRAGDESPPACALRPVPPVRPRSNPTPPRLKSLTVQCQYRRCAGGATQGGEDRLTRRITGDSRISVIP